MSFVRDPNAVSCVYWIRRPEHTDILSQGYIGISKRFERRLQEHLMFSQNRYLRNAINKYGWDNLIKEKVLIAKEDYCLEIESRLRPADKIGWNLTMGGSRPPITRWSLGKKLSKPSWNKGIPHAESTRKKLSIGVTKLWQDPEYRQRMSDAHRGKSSHMAGKKHTPESIERMRLAKLGKPSGKKGMKMSQEHNDKMKKLAAAQAWTCPHCNTSGLSKGAGNRWHFANCKGVR